MGRCLLGKKRGPSRDDIGSGVVGPLIQEVTESWIEDDSDLQGSAQALHILPTFLLEILEVEGDVEQRV